MFDSFLIFLTQLTSMQMMHGTSPWLVKPSIHSQPSSAVTSRLKPATRSWYWRGRASSLTGGRGRWGAKLASSRPITSSYWNNPWTVRTYSSGGMMSWCPFDFEPGLGEVWLVEGASKWSGIMAGGSLRWTMKLEGHPTVYKQGVPLQLYCPCWSFRRPCLE